MKHRETVKKYYCAVNTKYYKHSNFGGEVGHVLREMKENINAVKPLTGSNFGYSFGGDDVPLKDYYEQKLQEAKDAKKGIIQKHSNTYIDSVLIFNNVKFQEAIKNGKMDEINAYTKAFMKDFGEKTGFEPIGYEYHLDEGSVIDIKEYNDMDEEEKLEYEPVGDTLGIQYIKQNIHAHAIFLNYDFKEHKSVLKHMAKADWSDSQTLLHKHFKPLGFDRGEKKLGHWKDHKEKNDYVKELAIKSVELAKNHGEHLDTQNELLEEILESQKKLEKYDNLHIYAEKMKTFLERPKIQEKLKNVFGSNNFSTLKKMALNIYNCIKKPHEAPPEQEQEQDNKNDNNPEIEPPGATVVEEIDLSRLKQENEIKEATAVKTEKEIKNIKNRRKYGKTKNK